MTIEEEFDAFLAALESLHPNLKSSTAKGASNGPFLVEDGFRFGLFNIENFDKNLAAGAPFALVTRVVVPPRAVLNLALVFEGSELPALVARRDAILKTGQDAAKSRVYLSTAGLFVRQVDAKVAAADPTVIDANDPTFGTALKPSKAYYADMSRAGRLEQVELSYVAWLQGLLDPIAISLVRVGPTQVGGVRLDPAAVDVAEIRKRVRDLGGVYADELVDRYHVAMNHHPAKHFVLLTGISGTGKTRLAKAYGFAVLGLSDLQLDSEDVTLLPVRPDWTDPTYLLGYLDGITGAYRRTPFVDALLRADANRDHPVFVCLDEMNLAQPEHYFSDVMSAMESREPFRLHEGDPAVAGVPRRVPWPENLYVVGTVNVDETTRPFSPKLLDRANVIDMSAVDVPFFLASLASREPALAATIDQALKDTLVELHAVLAPHSLHFGYRTMEELVRYLSFAAVKGVLATALDLQIEQKILTKLRGNREHAEMLTKLHAVLDSKGFKGSARVVDRMMADLGAFDSFTYWA